MENDANKHLLDAAQKLNQADKELFKPEEDIVTFLVCKNSQFAIENYLRGYLIKKGIETSKYNTIDSLYKQCKKINKKFEKVNLSEFNCTGNNMNDKFCNEVSKVSNCYDVANSLDTLLREEKII
ncbi:HEPN domain-containing protein [Mariniflexile fucanivorans]|uniref:HEPN domain-containing protein n=1 Tax=Mariniflexile fucanivorans TaxID=264023 RepID=A0A4R1RQT9_9FLAO|nr:HEPN domain-containing protein [Mariniflexile fucanivorans]TCL68778.1 HEPN domain-containing protein [Mariniflexile fucanivorans]